MAATTVVPFLYPTSTPEEILEEIDSTLDYYKEVRWDICFVENTSDVFRKVAGVAGLFEENGSFSDGLFDKAFGTIYDEELIKRMMKDVHMDDSGKSWWRLDNYDYKY